MSMLNSAILNYQCSKLSKFRLFCRDILENVAKCSQNRQYIFNHLYVRKFERKKPQMSKYIVTLLKMGVKLVSLLNRFQDFEQHARKSAHFCYLD